MDVNINSKKTDDRRIDIRSLEFDELCKSIEQIGEKKFRAAQVFGWLHDKCVSDFAAMTNVPRNMKTQMEEYFEIRPVEVLEVLVSKVDGTRKYLMRLYDGNIIECVLMRYEYGNSICISSQVGCRMGCKFCASTVNGLVRNLSAGEMVGQIYSVAADIGDRINHVVIMGSGEPFDNYDEVISFVNIICDEKGQNLSGRNITISTCGIVPRIKEMADLKLQLTLALSLHATTDDKRKEIMPVANKYSIDEIIDALIYYYDMTKRRITFEYSLIAGVNDTDEDVKELSVIAKKVPSHINLIPVNPIKEREYATLKRDKVMLFKSKLEKNHVNATVRRTLGQDINASCGQLRQRYIEESAKTGDNS